MTEGNRTVGTREKGTGKGTAAMEEESRVCWTVGHRGRHRDEFRKSVRNPKTTTTRKTTSALKNRLSNCGFPSSAATHFDPNQRVADPEHRD